MELFHPYKVKVIFTPNIVCLWRLLFFQKQAALAELVLASLKERRRRSRRLRLMIATEKTRVTWTPKKVGSFFWRGKTSAMSGEI